MKKTIMELSENSLIKVDDKRYYIITKHFQRELALLQSEDGTETREITFECLVDVIGEVSSVRERGFEPVLSVFAKNVKVDDDGKYPYILPVRKTARSSGYDFVAPADFTLAAKQITIIPTNIKAYMLDDEELLVSIRSGLSTKGIMLMNALGKIDSDFYENPKDGGNIGFIFYNLSDNDYQIHKDDRIGQGTFSKYLKADNDHACGTRVGGLGSTGR